jgi:phosphate transport system substrate-binding protein
MAAINETGRKQMRKRSIRLAAAVLLVLTATAGAFGEEIKAGGGGTPIDGYLKPVKEHFEKATGITLTLNFSSATLAFKQLANNELDASLAGLAYDDFVKTLKKDHIEVNPAAYVGTVIGASKIYTIIHKSNPVAKLSLEQLKGIFTGKISNWKEVGGNDAPILVVLSKINPASNAAYQKLAMGDAPYAAEVLDAGRFEDLRELVSSNPEAIGFGPVTMLNGTVKVLDTPEISRPVILVTKGAPAPKVQKLIAFIKGAGQQYIKQ